MNTEQEIQGIRLRGAILACALGGLAVLLGVRLGLGTGHLPLTWDERYVQPIIDRIFHTQWRIGSLLDYDDTKGPVFFWLYAGFGEFFGRDLAALRWLSIIATALWAALLVALLDVGQRTMVRLCAVALLALTLPYAMVMSQLLMSEPTFLLGCAVMAVAAVRALGQERVRARRVEGPIVFGILLALLLHHRIHVVALAGAIVLLAAWRDRQRAWPWVVAALLAGLSRLPLYLRWGGLVGESYRERYSVGLRFDSLAYLLAALLPTIGLALVLMVMRRRQAPRWAVAVLLGAGLIGAALALLAPPGLTSDLQDLRFAGSVASLLRPIADSPAVFRGAMMMLAALGAMSLAAVVTLAWSETGGSDAGRQASAGLSQLATRLGALTILLGWLLSALASGDVYDRYLIAFTFLWPLWCVRHMPPGLLLAQVVWQTAFMGVQVWSGLVAR